MWNILLYALQLKALEHFNMQSVLKENPKLKVILQIFICDFY